MIATSISANLRARVERLGAVVLDGAAQGVELARIALLTVRGVFRSQRPPGEVAHQMFVVGNKSLLFVAVTLGLWDPLESTCRHASLSIL